MFGFFKDRAKEFVDYKNYTFGLDLNPNQEEISEQLNTIDQILLSLTELLTPNQFLIFYFVLLALVVIEFISIVGLIFGGYITLKITSFLTALFLLKGSLFVYLTWKIIKVRQQIKNQKEGD